jgi:hypothetical protein
MERVPMSNAATVHAMYEAFGRGDIAAILATEACLMDHGPAAQAFTFEQAFPPPME